MLATSGSAPREGFDAWCVVGAEPENADSTRRVAGLGRLLEDALDRSRDEWLALGRELGREPSAVLAHAPACAANVSDLGLMLAWTRLVEDWATQSRTVLVVCDDPWLFRHLAARPGVRAGRAAALWPAELRLGLRGILARAFVAACAFRAALRFGWHALAAPGGAWILSYAHPGSSADDKDAYFGDLMGELPALRHKQMMPEPNIFKAFYAIAKFDAWVNLVLSEHAAYWQYGLLKTPNMDVGLDWRFLGDQDGLHYRIADQISLPLLAVANVRYVFGPVPLRVPGMRPIDGPAHLPLDKGLMKVTGLAARHEGPSWQRTLDRWR
jgi:hypothetical protein